MQPMNRFKFALLFPTIIGVTILPIFPEGALEAPDPVSVDDDRVTASINNEQLNELLSSVRQPMWAGLWGLIARLGDGREVLEVRDGGEGVVEVQIGNLKAPLKGRGKTFLLQEEENNWKIIKVSDWYA